jgi:hypothetical protein
VKLCWLCKEFWYERATPGYSELTPGDDFGMSCFKNHWRFSAYKTTEEEFAKILQSAEACPDFVEKTP